MKAEFNEKERMSELGAGMLATIALLLFLAVFGVFKFYIVLRMSNDINFSNTPEMDSLILQQKVVTLLQAILLFVGALALYYSKSRWSVFGVIALMIFVMHVALLDLVKLLFTFDFSAFHLLSLLDIAVFA